MKILNGAELASYIKARQAQQVRALRQAEGIVPKLAIIQVKDDPVINTYVHLKEEYGQDILIEVEVYKVPQRDIVETIRTLNDDASVYGIIIQLPLEEVEQTEEVLNIVAPAKDVDGLGNNALFDAATPTAINWLLTGYNIELNRKRIVILGNGRLVGSPLARMWRQSGYDVEVLDEQVQDIQGKLKTADIIISATGRPGLLKSDMIPIDSIVVDAGVASEDGKKVGDISPEVYERQDLTMTPKRGGVGPLTVAALFDNVIRAARKAATEKK